MSHNQANQRTSQTVTLFAALSTPMNQDIEFCERFLNAGDRAKATCELVDLGESAVPILESIFNGAAKNKFGVSYNKLGMPLSCALVASGRLGTKVETLLHYIKAQAILEHSYAIEALEILPFSYKNT